MPGSDHKPRLKADLDPTSLELTGEEGYLLSRIDGMTTVGALSLLTGLSNDRVREILGRLRSQGALEDRSDSPGGRGRPPTRTPEDPCEEPAQSPAGDEQPSDQETEGPSEDPADEGEGDSQKPDDASEEEESIETAVAKGAGLRRLYMEDLSGLEVDARVLKAKAAEGDILQALCFDPHPKVIHAILENSKVGTTHARLIATHHRTGTGLGHLGRKAAFIRDRQTQRLLFRNPQLPDLLFEKILQPKRMSDAYRLTISRDVTERVKSNARRVFRKKFSGGTSEEKVALIITTEGRCLPMLLGVPLDGRAASILAGRPIHSTLLLQNLARWPATPPVVLIHLAKQPMAKRNPALADMLRRHPNAPSTLKRA